MKYVIPFLPQRFNASPSDQLPPEDSRSKHRHLGRENGRGVTARP